MNVERVLLYRHIGGRIHRDIPGERRAAYGRKIVATVSRELVAVVREGATRRPGGAGGGAVLGLRTSLAGSPGSHLPVLVLRCRAA